MTDAGARSAEAGNLVGVEMNAVGQPGARAEPADAVQIIHGAQAEALQAEVLFVEGFSQMRVQAHVEIFGHGRTLGHDLRRDRKRRAGCQRDLDLRTIAALVIGLDQALTVGQNHLALLHGLLWRQTSVGFTKAHRTTRQHCAHTQLANALHLNIDGVFQPVGEQVVMVSSRCATRQQQFSQRHLAGDRELLRRQARPYRVQGFQPREQRLIDHWCPGPREGLIEVMVRVDQPRQQHMLTGIECLCAGL
ncbi:hypothetical protein ALP03_03168 [Pseudomonas amygdali pv. tabaci]|uniref:Uncharacterized protein n=1 Tax=Pseudomonas amygdali pv. tabaci TaxID=322 RepID=A0A3M6FPR2_PSEAJ|nr:hypothetical protein ALP03_03168 [Pseudomonas amygdali pv. tabaci]